MNKLPILIIEDSPEDYEATERALKKSGLDNPIYHCEDGDEALDFLFHHGPYADVSKAPRPGFILIDLNLPGTDGETVLKAIKQDAELKTIPTIILTTSSNELDIEGCYQAGGNGYLQKPVDLDGFIQAIQRLKEFWFEVALVPGNEKKG